MCLLRGEGEKSESELLDNLRFQGLLVSCGGSDGREDGGLTRVGQRQSRGEKSVVSSRD